MPTPEQNPPKIKLPEFARDAYNEISASSDYKKAYALIAAHWLSDKQMSTDEAVKNLQDLIDSYKSLPENLDNLDVESRKNIESIKKTWEKINSFFASFNEEFAKDDKDYSLSSEEMLLLYDKTQLWNQGSPDTKSPEIKIHLTDSLEKLFKIQSIGGDKFKSGQTTRIVNSLNHLSSFAELSSKTRQVISGYPSFGPKSFKQLQAMLEFAMEEGILPKTHFPFFK